MFGWLLLAFAIVAYSFVSQASKGWCLLVEALGRKGGCKKPGSVARVALVALMALACWLIYTGR